MATNKNMKRYETLDWLRGLMAFSIMIYHLVAWTLVNPDAGSILGIFGVYGVSVFFVLSGLSMAIVYNNYIDGLKTSFIFFIRRIFRLLPLLWVAIIIVSVLEFMFRGELDLYKLFLNFTLLFGFVAPGEYINTGAWSVGNEVFYYALTPFLIMLYTKDKILGNFVVFLTIFFGIFYAFNMFDYNKNLANQWGVYINPFNNLFFYTCGMAIYYNFHLVKLRGLAPYLIIFSLAIFTFYPVGDDQINIVSGFNRIVFSIASILLTLGFYKLEINLPKWFLMPFMSLGEATYGVYLFHPIIFIFVGKLVENPVFCILATSILSIIFANISYKFYEKPFIKLGRKITMW